MGTKETMFEEEIASRSEVCPPYKGSVGKTRMESVLWTSPSGEILSVRVHTSVNATTDPALAERLCAGTLNWIRSPEDDELHPVMTPVVYHHERLPLFLLILPEQFRCRELEERAALLQRIAADKSHGVPRYVYDFGVVFGHEELSAVIGLKQSPKVETTPVRPPPQRYLAREEAYALTKDTVPRAGQGVQVKQALKNRSLGVKLPTPSKPFAPVSSAAEHPAAEASTGSTESARALLQADAEAILEEMESIEGWPEQSNAKAPAATPTKAKSESGEAETEAETVTEDAVLASTELPSADDEADRASKKEITPPPLATDEQRSESVAEPSSGQTASPAQKVLDADEVGAEIATEPMPQDQASAQERAALEEMGEQKQGADLPAQLKHWLDSEQTHCLYLHEDKVCLAARLETKALEAFIGADMDTLIQLFKTPTYPLTVVTVQPAGNPTQAQSWLMDLLDEKHLQVLEHLGADFRFQLDLYEMDLSPVVRREIHAPLEENARLVRKKAMEHLTNLGSVDPDLKAAENLWSAPDFPHLEDTEHPFEEHSFETLDSAQSILTALETLADWADEEHEDKLLLVHSFPCVWWRKIKDRIIKGALEHGLWLPEPLRAWALTKGYATSSKDMVRTALANFTHLTRDDKNNLSPGAAHKNWQGLLAEAERLGVPPEPEAEQAAEKAAAAVEKQNTAESTLAKDSSAAPQNAAPFETDQSPAQAEASPDPSAESTAQQTAAASSVETDRPSADLDDGPLSHTTADLVDSLHDKDNRLKAAATLCERGDPSTLPALFEAVRMMTRQEVLQILPTLVSFGEPSAPFFIEDLKSNKSFLRQGAALALGVMRSGDAIDPLVDCLLNEPTGIWREVARVLGEIGPGALMSLASRLRSANAESRERISWAMAHIAAAVEPKDPLEALSESQDSVAVTVTQRARDLMAEAKKAAEDSRRPEMEGESVVEAFTRRFFQALVNDERELTEADIIEAEDIVDQQDIIEEHAPEEDAPAKNQKE
jgi:hypothetical protein